MSAFKRLAQISDFYKNSKRTDYLVPVLARLMHVCQHPDFASPIGWKQLLRLQLDGRLTDKEIGSHSQALLDAISSRVAHGLKGNLREILGSKNHKIDLDDVVAGTRDEFIRTVYAS